MDSQAAGAIAQEMTRMDTTEMDGKYLTFWIDGQLFGVPIADVVQIVGMQPTTQVPEFPSYAKGIINLRGSIVPVIDVRLRLNKAEAEYNERTCIIVTDINQAHMGFIVDEVDAVIVIADELISAPPRLSSSGDSYVTGVGRLEGRVTLLLDPRKILGADELKLLTQATQPI